MANIKVHILNFYSIFTHIELVLENTSSEPHTYYGINRWEEPSNDWVYGGPQYYIEQASSVYSFNIEASPLEIITNWQTYWYKTRGDASIVGNNCGVAAECFLTEFAGIPKPSLSNISFNHLAFGIFWPSFIPFPITLPGRIASNAEFHIESRNHPELADQYSSLFLYSSIALATLLFSTSVFALMVASTILTGGIATLAVTACITTSLASAYGFFTAINLLSAKNIADENTTRAFNSSLLTA